VTGDETVGAPIRLLLVDDHAMVRSGLETIVGLADDMVVVGQAATVREAVDEADRLRPDVVLMDVRLTDGSGVDAAREIRARLPQTAVLMLTATADDSTVMDSILAGAAGFVLKSVKPSELTAAVRKVAAGESLLDSTATALVLDGLRRNRVLVQDEKLARLSAQESRILKLVAEGKTNREIAADLHLADKTVKNYVSSILAKLEVQRRSEAAAYFARKTGSQGP
jgi:two-component system, NarL family, response regulator DevR